MIPRPPRSTQSRSSAASDVYKRQYLLRGLAVAGWAPSFAECARCGAPGPHQAFAVALGGAVCAACRPPGATAPSPEAFLLLAALLSGDWAVADASTERARRDASGLVAAFLQFHLERTVRSLRLVDRAEYREFCLLYTSDAADDLPCVALG